MRYDLPGVRSAGDRVLANGGLVAAGAWEPLAGRGAVQDESRHEVRECERYVLSRHDCRELICSWNHHRALLGTSCP